MVPRPGRGPRFERHHDLKGSLVRHQVVRFARQTVGAPRRVDRLAGTHPARCLQIEFHRNEKISARRVRLNVIAVGHHDGEARLGHPPGHQRHRRRMDGDHTVAAPAGRESHFSANSSSSRAVNAINLTSKFIESRSEKKRILPSRSMMRFDPIGTW